MAKQSGLHQIRGKVGEHSYYKQTGVSAGLIRSINQGLSSRVKTGAEYVNTRLNNDEFAQACRIAAKLITYITPKFRPMILPFSQAKLAKDLLQLIKEDSAAWGQRNIDDADGSKTSPLLTALSKNNYDEYGVSVYGEDYQINVEAKQPLFSEKLAAMGAEGIDVRVIMTDTWIGKAFNGGGGYVTTSAHMNVYDVTLQSTPTAQSIDAVYPADPTAPTLQSGSRMVVVILMPYRTVGGSTYTLQEHCAFKAFEKIDLGD